MTPPLLRIGSVSYLNARPLIHGLERFPDLQLTLDVPARLIDGLRSNRYDIALLPVIDYQHLPGARIVPSGGIGSDGPTLTVRIFSKIPIEKIDSLACDTESHTSVALARVILAERFGLHPEITSLSQYNDASDTAILLIGDKVVTHEPRSMPYQLDLGAAWKQQTGLPFVFAVWTVAPGVDLRDLPARLDHARQEGLAHLPSIIASHATPRGWPPDLALQYLSKNLKFEITPRDLDAIRLFHTLCATHKLIPRAAPLELY